MEREVIWAAWEGPGLEHLRLVASDGSTVANGLVIGMEGGRPFRIGYEIRCDARWRVREIRVAAPDSGRPGIDLLADGEGHWTTRGGEAVPELEGCVDVDVSATPFTNTLPIRRLGLGPEESAELDVAYVAVPELVARPETQRYVCLNKRADGGLYRFEAPPSEVLPSGFTAEIPVDTDGLVIDYPGLFRRAWSG
ncbi:MAG: putative glycolipid-binding domain-containing protein [Actinomycetota bacterium]|nr:putative glycolipid-binding domain-containing protein [Actinomycetota bacterium]